MIRNLMIFLFASAVMTAAANAQVNGFGPSDPNDFDTVINVPADSGLLAVSSATAAVPQPLRLK